MSATRQTDQAIYKRASAHGRFQPFHNGHLTYLLLAKSRCDNLVVGITNPDHRHLRPHPADPTRHLPQNNPFSYFERLQMISDSLVASGVGPDRFTIVPFPIDAPELLHLYCPKVPVLMRHRGEWTLTKIALLRQHGWEPEIIADSTDLGFSATDVRQRILANEPWHHLVPAPSRSVLDAIDVRSRISTAVQATDGVTR